MRFGSAVRIIPALILAFAGSVAFADGTASARYLGSFHWTIDKPWFGGWSGIELSSDGTGMTAITDRGRLLRATIKREKGRIIAVAPQRMWRLKSSSGYFLTRRVSDSEGLALAPDGTIHISFEGVSRVAHYSNPASSAKVSDRHMDFRGFSSNKSLEALAMDHRGRLFTIPEHLENDTTIQVYVQKDGKWSVAFTLPGGDGFLPVGADFDGNGRLYLLERAWNLFGFRTRVRRWEMNNDRPSDERLLVLTDTGTHDNLEGLAVWRDNQGRTRLTMIADDNFLFFQRTEIVEYALQE